MVGCSGWLLRSDSSCGLFFQDDVDAHGGVQLLCRLRDYTVYSCLNARNQLRAPTEWGLCLRPVGGDGDGEGQSAGAGLTRTSTAALKCLACDSERVRTCLLTAMRLAKVSMSLTPCCQQGGHAYEKS